jgi:hypothetical protein
MAEIGTLMNVPFQLRGNDVQRHIINIDTRFRDSIEHSKPSNFYFTLQAPIRNILRIRITSFEFPNNYYMFTDKRKNTSFRVIFQNISGEPTAILVTIPEGSYTACEMAETLNSIFTADNSELPWLSIEFDQISGRFTFRAKRKFAIDTMYETYDRPYDYGLGYYLGFGRDLHKAQKEGDMWLVTSCFAANFAGDSYILMRLNDYVCVRHMVEGSEITAFAKFVLREQKNYVTFDDYASQHIKEIVFTSPQDISRLHVQIMDPYGYTLDLCKSNFSFSLEVLEIKNVSLYETVRNSLSTRYV